MTGAAPDRSGAGWAHGSTGAAMIGHPRTCGRTTTVHQAREVFRDDHVHALLVVDRGVLLAVVERGDLAGRPAAAPVRWLGTLAGRTVDPTAPATATRDRMRAGGRRRLAVVDGHGRLLGLLCLKRSGAGFCTDEGVRARAAERAARRRPHIGATRS
ncbi:MULTISPECIES: CBS domain-containing protein [Pseudonocardia]|uniref:CBS domain-containing protein n=1 Tax=Pseudonocardia TaxID=1847 RepID=UPI001AD7D37B|nr:MULTISPECIES: CBS domain-containing protein [Pseudonocardia]MBO4238696.1 CBS domain-containing protein [Pseudonocardia alni]